MDDDKPFSVRGVLEKAASVILGTAVVVGATALASLHDRLVASEFAVTRITSDFAELTQRVRDQEQRPPRLSGQAEALQRDIASLEADQRQCREQMIAIQGTIQNVREVQGDLCNRLRACDDLWKRLR